MADEILIGSCSIKIRRIITCSKCGKKEIEDESTSIVITAKFLDDLFPVNEIKDIIENKSLEHKLIIKEGWTMNGRYELRCPECKI